MFRRIEDWMAKELKISGNELLIYGVIYSSQNQTYVRGQTYLAEITGLSIATIKRSLKGMVENGLIEKVSKGYQIVSNGYLKVSKGAIRENEEKYQIDTWTAQNDTKKVSKGATYINTTNTKNIKENKKEKKPTPSVKEILDEFIAHADIKNERAIKAITTRLEYKQGSKHKYTKVNGAIQQIQMLLGKLGDKDRVGKLEFCVNNSIANNWQGLGWFEQSEKEFYAWLKQEQKVKKTKEIEEIEGNTYGADTIDSIINKVVEDQIKQGIIQEF